MDVPITLQVQTHVYCIGFDRFWNYGYASIFEQTHAIFLITNPNDIPMLSLYHHENAHYITN